MGLPGRRLRGRCRPLRLPRHHSQRRNQLRQADHLSLTFADGSPVYACSPLQFALAYLLLAFFLVLWGILQKVLPNDMPQPIMPEDEAASEMDKEAMSVKKITIGSLDNWWAMAGTSTQAKVESSTA